MKVSVCVPTYNGELFIKPQLESILKQLSLNDEVIISDDSSTDNTIKIIEEINDSRVVILRDNKFRSPVFNLENALKASTGEIIFSADQDDVWLDNKVEVCLKALKNADLVISDCYVTDSQLNIVEESFYVVNGASFNKFAGLLKRNPYLGCCLAFKREILQKALPFPRNIKMHDIWLGNVAAFFYRANFIKDKLIYYRRHSNNVTPTGGGKSSLSVFEKLKYRVDIIFHLLKLIGR